jgi:hypothetical protein
MTRNEYNQLLAEAKRLNIKGYGQMKKDALMDAIEHALVEEQRAASEASRNTPVMAADVQSAKRFEYISADNMHVQFRAAKDIVTVYWGDDFKMHINSGRRGDRLTSYATLISMFKPFNNGVDGDIARIVKAIVRIKQLPAALKVQQHHAQQSAASTSVRTPKRGVVDPDVLSAFVAAYADAYDMNVADVRNHRGYVIQHFFSLHADELQQYDADEIIYNYIGCLLNMQYA